MKEANVIKSNVRALQVLLMVGLGFCSYQIYHNMNILIKKDAARYGKQSSVEKDYKSVKTNKKTPAAQSSSFDYNEDIKVATNVSITPYGEKFTAKICSSNWGSIDGAIFRFIGSRISGVDFKVEGRANTFPANSCALTGTKNENYPKGRLALYLRIHDEYAKSVKDVETREVDIQSQKLELRISKDAKVVSACSDTNYVSAHISRLVSFIKNNSENKKSIISRVQHPDKRCTIILFNERLIITDREKFEEDLNARIRKNISIWEIK